MEPLGHARCASRHKITNFSMLSIMLGRDEEADIWKQTQKWLEQPSSTFTLVVDELHMYRGTPGTEVAYLIRRLLRKLDSTTSQRSCG